MKKTDPAYIAIVNWFNSTRDYDQGVELYRKYGKNNSLKNTFPGRANRFKRKLEYELSKLIGIDFSKVDKAPVATTSDKNKPPVKKTDLKSTSIPAVVNQKMVMDNKDLDVMTLPVLIRRITYEFHDLYVKRGKAHMALKKVPEQNSEGNNAQRLELLRQMERFSSRMDTLHRTREEWGETGNLPDEKSIYPGKTTKIVLNRDQLLKKKLNIQKSLSKDQNLLLYQAKTKKDKESPMPPGPKREKVEARIKAKEEDILQINKAINGIS